MVAEHGGQRPVGDVRLIFSNQYLQSVDGFLYDRGHIHCGEAVGVCGDSAVVE